MEEEEEEEEEKKKLKALLTSDSQAGSAEPAQDEPGTSAGSARLYDCIFCKRGFTTAQALGGHMNIHRKDRARLRPTGPSSSGPRKGEQAYHPYSRAQIGSVSKQTAEPSYAVYLPSSTAEGSRRPAELVQAGEERRLGSGGSDQKEKGKKKEEDLDLELRLGHSKSHESSSD